MTRALRATVPATTEAMKAAGKKYDPVIYDGAGHGFMRAVRLPTPTTRTRRRTTTASNASSIC